MAALAGEPCRPDKPIAPCLNYFSDAATSHPDTLVQQWMLVEAVNLSMVTGDSAQAEDFLQRLEQEHPESPLLGFARGILEPRPTASVGGPLPDLRVSALEDSSVVFDNESLLGKTVLIDVWATWCDSCLAELPGLLQAYRDYHDRGLEVLGCPSMMTGSWPAISGGSSRCHGSRRSPKATSSRRSRRLWGLRHCRAGSSWTAQESSSRLIQRCLGGT